MRLDVQMYAQQIREECNSFIVLQTPSGALISEDGIISQGEVVLKNIIQLYERLCKALGTHALRYSELLANDVQSWLMNGIDTPPNFLATHDRWHLSQGPNEFSPFLAPIRVPNNPHGNSFVLTLALMRPHQFASDACKEIIEYVNLCFSQTPCLFSCVAA